MNNQLNKYSCDKCNFKCNYKSQWNLHIDTELHKTGIKKTRSDKKDLYKCEQCEYKTKNIVIFKQHKLNEHGTTEEKKEKFKYYCDNCDFGTFSKEAFSKHSNTTKHKNFILILSKKENQKA